MKACKTLELHTGTTLPVFPARTNKLGMFISRIAHCSVTTLMKEVYVTVVTLRSSFSPHQFLSETLHTVQLPCSGPKIHMGPLATQQCKKAYFWGIYTHTHAHKHNQLIKNSVQAPVVMPMYLPKYLF